MRAALLNPLMRQGGQSPENASPWYRISNKAKASNVTKVYIYDVIGGWFGIAVQDFIKELNDIDTDEIHVHINSPGGAVYDGISIYNALRQHDAEVHTIVDGLAASAASFIAQAGAKRIMARNATMMIHDAIGGCYGNMKDMLETATILDRVSNNIADIYSKNAGGEAAEWRELMKAETWYSGAEALEANLCSEMLDADDEDDEADTSNKWDLTQFFNYAGREFAPSPFDLRKKVRNQLKEARMSGTIAPSNTEGAPEGTPPETTTEPAEETESGTETTTQPAEAAPEVGVGVEVEVTPAQSNSLVNCAINGAQFQVPSAVASHILALETFRNEAITQSRRDAVTALARDNKIPATQIDTMQDFVVDLNDAQFAKWKASFDAAPAASLFGTHGVTPGNESRPANQSGGEPVAEQISTLENVIADHRRVGMTQEQIETKDSWKRLQALKSTQTTQ